MRSRKSARGSAFRFSFRSIAAMTPGCTPRACIGGIARGQSCIASNVKNAADRSSSCSRPPGGRFEVRCLRVYAASHGELSNRPKQEGALLRSAPPAALLRVPASHQSAVQSLHRNLLAEMRARAKDSPAEGAPARQGGFVNYAHGGNKYVRRRIFRGRCDRCLNTTAVHNTVRDLRAAGVERICLQCLALHKRALYLLRLAFR